MAGHLRWPRAKAKGREVHARAMELGRRFSEVALRSGVSARYVELIANGYSCPLPTAYRIARGLDCSIEQLFVVVEKPAGNT